MKLVALVLLNFDVTIEVDWHLAVSNFEHYVQVNRNYQAL